MTQSKESMLRELLLDQFLDVLRNGEITPGWAQAILRFLNEQMDHTAPPVPGSKLDELKDALANAFGNEYNEDDLLDG